MRLDEQPVRLFDAWVRQLVRPVLDPICYEVMSPPDYQDPMPKALERIDAFVRDEGRDSIIGIRQIAGVYHVFQYEGPYR